MDQVQIETGIPVPQGRETKYPWDEMEVGDSFFAEVKSNSSLYVSAGRRKDRKYRIAPDLRDGVEGFRVWRVG